MSKYIVKNCPAYDEGDCISSIEHIPHATACQHIEDCKLKQIVELCNKIIFRNSNTDFKERFPDLAIGENFVAKQVLQLLDIQEVE